MTTIKQEVIDQIKTSNKAKTRLAYEFDVHQATIDRWLDKNDPMLTTPMGIKCITEELEVNEQEILAA